MKWPITILVVAGILVAGPANAVKHSALSNTFTLAASADYGIQISVPKLEAGLGSTITVEISVDDATGIASADIILEYNPAILDVKEVRLTDLTDTALMSWDIRVVGQVLIAMASFPGLAGGSGALIEVDFEAIGEGETPLTLSNVAFFDEISADIPITVVDGSVTVKGTEINPVISPSLPLTSDNLVGSYIDMDGDLEDGSEIRWYMDGVLQTEYNDVLTIPSSATSAGQEWYFTVRPSDGVDFGDPVTSNSVAVGNATPVVEDVIASGGAGQATITYTLIDTDGDLCSLTVEYQGGSVQGSAWARATIDEPTTNISPGTELQLTWRSDIDEPGQSANDYRIRITPNDGLTEGISGLSPSFSFSSNSPPIASGPLILPESPIASDDLEASYVFVDSDGDVEARPEIHWYRNGFQELMYNNLAVLPSRATSSGDRWYYTIRVNDGKEYGRLQTSKDVAIRNAPPEATNVVLTPDQPGLNDQLVSHYNYEDADGDSEVGTRIQWYRNGIHRAEFDSFAVIPGALTLSGDEWYFTVMPGDGLGFGIPQQSNKVFIANEPPVASGLDILPPKPFTTDTLQGSYIYSDPERDPESGSKIIWYKGDVRQPKYDDTFILPATATVKNQLWYFTVQPRDGKQFGTVQRSTSVVIGNTPPRVENPAVSPPYPFDKDDLFADYDFIDVDGDSEGTSEVKWYRNDIWIPDYSERQLPARATSDGEIWYFKVRPKDDVAFGAELISGSVEIGNPVPRANSLTVVPDTPLTTEALIASYIYVDPRNIPESDSQISWYKNGFIQPTYTENILPQEATFKGEQWYFSVAPSNGSQIGEEQSSIPVTIINSPPVLTNVTVLPSVLTTDDNMVVDYIFEDADGDVEAGNEIKWYRNGILQAAYSNMTELPASVNRRGEDWYFTIRSRDDTVFSNLATAPTVTIGNARPKIIGLNVLPVDPLTDSDLRVVYSYVDTEGDPEVGTEIRWFRNDLHEPNYDDLYTVPADATARDDSWHCTVRSSDGLDFGDLSTSPVVIIGNATAVADGLSISPLSPLTRDSLMGSYSYSDLDNDPEEGSEIRWYVGGLLLPAYNDTLTIPSSATSAGQGWYFTVRPSDGESFGELRQSDTVTIGNAPPLVDGLSISPLSPLTGDNLLGSYSYSDLDDDREEGSEIRWYMDGMLQTKYNDVLTIPSSSTLAGQEWYFAVRPSDGESFGELRQSDTVTIGNAAPLADGLSISPLSPLTGDSLLGSYSYSDLDDDREEGSEVRWYMDGVLQTKYNDVLTIPSSSTSAGQEWYFAVRPSDGESFGGLKQSGIITIGNTAPAAEGLDISPLLPKTGDDLVYSYDCNDIDGDPEEGSEIRWYMNSVMQTAYNDVLTIPSSATSSGQEWYFTVRSNDGRDYGTLEISSTVVVWNSRPLSKINGPYEGVVGMAVQFTSAGSSDIDDDILMYAWDFDHRNGKDDVDSTDPNPTYVYTEPGVYSVTLTVNDGALVSDIDTAIADIKVEINGSIRLQGYSGKPVTATISLRSVDTDKALETFPIVTEDGNFTILTSLELGPYDIVAESEQYLKGIARSVSISGGLENVKFDPEISGFPAGELRGGDCNGDDTVTLEDLSLLAYHYNRKSDVADINGDGKVDRLDFVILESNLGVVGIDGHIPDPPDILAAVGDGNNRQLKFHVYSDEDMSAMYPGDEFDVHVSMEDASHLKGYSISLHYDRNTLQLLDLGESVREGEFLKSNPDDGSTLFVSKVSEEGDSAGKVAVLGYITGDGSGVDGTGVAATLRFRLIKSETGVISIQNSIVADDRGETNILPTTEIALATHTAETDPQAVRILPPSKIITPAHAGHNDTLEVLFRADDAVRSQFAIYDLGGYLIYSADANSLELLSNGWLRYTWNGRADNHPGGEVAEDGLYIYFLIVNGKVNKSTFAIAR